MPYDANIPQPNDILSVSQDDILNNFQAIDAWALINHGGFNTPQEGKHFEVTLPENGAPTNTLINEANIYADTSAITGAIEMYWQRANNGDRIEWTGLLSAADGWTRVPSGILIKWGSDFVPGFNSPIVYPVAANIPVFTAAYHTFLIANVGAGATDLCNIVFGSQTVLGFSANGFDINGAATGVTISYITIGI